MSRHSKNNTASAIFTNGERLRLQDWGTIKQRVGKDSQKAFDQCVLCLSRVIDPMCCTAGHMFCKVCIIENLMIQKKQHDLDFKRYERELDEYRKRKSDELQSKQNTNIKHFEKVELTVPESNTTLKETKLNQISDDKERDHLRFIDKMQSEKNKSTTLEEKKDEEKREWIKTSFWAPDNTPMEKESKSDEPLPPSKCLYCPAVKSDDKQEAHKVKVKELISLKIDENSQSEFTCWTCQKPLIHQKIAVLRKCGHVMCRECVLSFSFKGKDTVGRCTKCDHEINRNKDIIELKESGSAFSGHSQVEAKVYKPSFQS